MQNNEFTPLKDKILIKRDEAQTTAGTIIIPDKAVEKELTGEVIAVGTEVTDEIFVGCRVLFGKIDGVSIAPKYVGSDGDFILVREDQIRAVLHA